MSINYGDALREFNRLNKRQTLLLKARELSRNHQVWAMLDAEVNRNQLRLVDLNNALNNYVHTQEENLAMLKTALLKRAEHQLKHDWFDSQAQHHSQKDEEQRQRIRELEAALNGTNSQS